MNVSTITPQIASFADAVRDALSDLTETEREELTEGLEADLAEAYAEDLARELPDPVEYAAELRSAAGLPVRSAPSQGWLHDLGTSIRSARANITEAVRSNPTASTIVDFLGDLRPVWWVARAWVAFWCLSRLLGDGYWWLLLVGGILISVQWGRGKWRFPGAAAVIAVGNVVAAVLLVPAIANAQGYSNYAGPLPYSVESPGLYLDGLEVANLYAYGADGKPLTDVQIFTENGTPVRTMNSGSETCIDPDCLRTGQWVARVLETGTAVDNVFPMTFRPTTIDPLTGEAATQEIEQPQWPFEEAVPVIPQETSPDDRE